MLQKDVILRVENISKAFYEVKALQNISFDIYKGEILGLLGANGAGKSTLLKIIGGVQRSDKGDIDIVNLWPNRMIGDTALPAEKRFNRSNVTKERDAKLLDSGLLGPVRVQTSH